MKQKILKSLCVLFCLGTVFSICLVSASEIVDKDKFDDSKWGIWSRIFPEGNFTEKEREPLLPKVVDGAMEFSIHSIYATGFVNEEKISPHSAKVTLHIKDLPQTGKGEVMYDGVNNFNCFFMVGLSDDSLKKNSRDWIFRSTGIYLMITPISTSESKFSLTYNYEGSRTDEMEREERAVDNLLQFEGITLPVALKDTFEVEFTKDDIVINHNGVGYSFTEKANNSIAVFDKYYHQKAYKALNGEAHKCFAIYNSVPQSKPSTMVIKDFTGQQPKTEDGVIYDAVKTVTNSDTVSSKSLADADSIESDNSWMVIITVAAVVAVAVLVILILLLKKSKKNAD